MTSSASENGKAAHTPPQPLLAALVLQLSWTKLVEIIRLDYPWKRAFYENECLQGNRSVRQLQRQIGSLLYERTALSKNKQAVVANIIKARRAMGFLGEYFGK